MGQHSVFICHSLVLSEGYVRSTPLYTVYMCVCVCVYVGVCVKVCMRLCVYMSLLRGTL